ncbi:hypothetical protein ACF8EF_20720 [Pseudomonas sp. zjy_15]|uniref:hypothetical protein n=1 Tax=Pseudomonas sp. zjy_15 TaxID=3367265 RepID=UPI00370B144D
MNSKLSLIARQVERREQQQAPAPVETSGIGGAIEAVIERMVEERVAAALAEQRRQLEFNKPKPVTDYRDLPPIPRTRAPKAMECQLYRDELRRVNRISIGTMEFVVQRNEVGQVVRMVPADIAPLPPAVPPADINRGA